MKAYSIPKKVNSKVVRLVGGQVFLLSLLFIVTQEPFIPAFLLIDFATRALGLPRYSLLAYTGILLARLFKMKEKPIFFAPKRFAAGIGLFLSTSSLISVLLGAGELGVGIISLLGIFSFLEG
ncbi:DUF4395 domain-containing protein, partial [Oceanispirochaeta sp.]|uniref:DUF4395 domain-containing protein n=1 Tax=Oceanispirochaeta sp. TaxID=2035350 RepID=UPI0026016618